MSGAREQTARVVVGPVMQHGFEADEVGGRGQGVPAHVAGVERDARRETGALAATWSRPMAQTTGRSTTVARKLALRRAKAEREFARVAAEVDDVGDAFEIDGFKRGRRLVAGQDRGEARPRFRGAARFSAVSSRQRS